MQGLSILLYHQVADVPAAQDPYHLAVHPDQFAAHMAYLHTHGFHCLPLKDAVRALAAGEPLPPRAVAITFDDGYLDNYTTAWPVLRQYGLTATIFLVAGQLGGPTNWAGQDGDRAAPLMTWDHAREMQAAGIDFGSHTQTHASLDTLDDDTARRELTQSKAVIEGELGQPVTLLAYPYERFTARTLQLVEECGYAGACGSPRLRESRYNLWRAELFSDDGVPVLAAKLGPRWRTTQEAKRQLRKVRRLLRR